MRMEVIDPDGQTSTAYSQNLTVVAGSAEGVIPLALNDEPGRWRILLRDLTSGRKREARFEVGP
jgi:hypothetical protein